MEEEYAAYGEARKVVAIGVSIKDHRKREKKEGKSEKATAKR